MDKCKSIVSVMILGFGGRILEMGLAGRGFYGDAKRAYGWLLGCYVPLNVLVNYCMSNI